MTLINLGERTYEICNEDISKCRELYAMYTGNQNGFEELMKSENIDFLVDMSGYY